MADVYTKHAGSLRSLQNELGGACPQMYFNGQLVRVLPNGAKFRRESGPGGFTIDTDIQLTCLAADFGANLPTSKNTFNYPGQGGQLFKIVSVTPAPNGLQIRINGDRAKKL